MHYLQRKKPEHQVVLIDVGANVGWYSF